MSHHSDVDSKAVDWGQSLTTWHERENTKTPVVSGLFGCIQAISFVYTVLWVPFSDQAKLPARRNSRARAGNSTPAAPAPAGAARRIDVWVVEARAAPTPSLPCPAHAPRGPRCRNEALVTPTVSTGESDVSSVNFHCGNRLARAVQASAMISSSSLVFSKSPAETSAPASASQTTSPSPGDHR